MRLNGLDLNLLIALRALLTERSISRAAQRVFLSQPAMSNALARLRAHLGDDLVVRTGRRMVLTARAEALVEPVREILMRIESTVAAPPRFDAATATRRFSLLVSDYTAQVLVKPLLQRLASCAPQVCLQLLSQSAGDAVARLESGEIDLMVVPEKYRSQRHPSMRLFEDSYVCVASADNRTLRDGLSLAQYQAAGHVVTQFGDGRIPLFDGWLMERSGVQRRIEVSVPSLTMPIEMVLGTARIATVHRRLAEQAVGHLPIVIWPVPLEIPALVEYAQWNRMRDDDPAVRWLVGELHEVGQRLPAPALRQRGRL